VTAGTGEWGAPWSRVYLAGWLEPSEVHQAAGMVMVQLSVGPADAIARLRGYAALTDRPLTEVARAVLDRSLHFEPVRRRS
jgi:hypothetical protein